ncbi:LysR family transcriptional regulator [Vibrio ponticus]|uniref:LysR family transcriptional regulator n=1 Tax=Vibrio ponticus TaxID=265668 RepID=A0ABX3FNU1_9VIBR|nr:LysR family transcriptional regulator [Vibrio ponticus]OLQ95708.1 LysR family transcriptional regulator [Vibrio ponticus]
MKFSQLSAFKAIVECQTMTSAANRLHLSQPAVSRLLSNLEEQIGFKLFTRQGNRLILSSDGQAFYIEVEKVFDSLLGLEQAAKLIKTNQFGSINIAAMPLLSNAYLPKVLGRFLQQTPKLKVGLKTYRSEDVLRHAQSQAIDIGFSFVGQGFSGVNYQHIECECVCLLPASSPLAQLAVIDIHDIANQVIIRHEKDSPQNRIDTLLRRYDLGINEQIEVSLASTASALVEQGVGIALTDPFTAVLDSANPLLVMRPLAFSLPFEFDILYPALKPINRHAERFIEQFLLLADELGIELKVGQLLKANH